MDADLVCPACQWPRFQQRGAIGIAAQHAKLRARGITILFIHFTAAQGTSLRTDRGVTGKHILCRMSLHAHKIPFLHLTARELRLHLTREVPRARHDDEACGVGIQAMAGAQLLRVVNFVEDVLQRVAIEPASGMHRQRRRFLQHHQRLVFMQQANIGIHVRFHVCRHQLHKAFAGTDRLLGRGHLHVFVEKAVVFKTHQPLAPRDHRQNRDQRVQQRHAIAMLRHRERAVVVIRRTAGQRRGQTADRCMSFGNAFLHLLLGCLEAIRAGHILHITRISLILIRQRRLAHVALGGLRFLQPRVHAHTLIEDEALAIIMVATHLFEVLQNAAFKLPDLLKAFALHEGGRLLTADAARAEGHNRLLLQFRRQGPHGGGKITKRVHPDHMGVFKCAQLHFVIIARVQKHHRAAFIQPLFQCPRLHPW